MKKFIKNIVFIVFIIMTLRIGILLFTRDLIIIDAGHGGHDVGTVAINGAYEKEVNLAIARKLYEELLEEGYRVKLIREDDSYIDIYDRAKIANRSNAKMFISIHANAMENNSETNGLQLLYNTDKDYELASYIMNEVLFTTKSMDKGIIEREDLVVLNQTKMPAVIVETGFLSNPREADLLLNEDYQNILVDGIVNAINLYEAN